MADQEPPPSRAPEPPPPSNPDVSQSVANARRVVDTRLTPGTAIRDSGGSTTHESSDTTTTTRESSAPTPPVTPRAPADASSAVTDPTVIVRDAPRPVEELLRDPLGEVARKERRSLLGISAIAILVGWAGLVPQKIENFGITFTVSEQRAVLWVSFGIVFYYTVAFVVYALPDWMRLLYAIHQKLVELRNPAPPGSNDLPPRADQPWGGMRYVSRVSRVRLGFDLIVPVIVAVYAMWALWGAVHRVEDKPTAAKPATSATAPAPKLDAAPTQQPPQTPATK